MVTIVENMSDFNETTIYNLIEIIEKSCMVYLFPSFPLEGKKDKKNETWFKLWTRRGID